MPIIEPVIRPPAEADSFLLQITTGCSANTCTFCGAYKGKPFRIKNDEEITRDIKTGAVKYPDARRVFLMDGDALALNNEKLLPVLNQLTQSFPKLSRVAGYANGYNITARSDLELTELAQAKLKLIYIGLESGSQQILDHCKKRSQVAEMVKAVQQAEKAGIKSSVMVLLGLGGKKYSAEHVSDTIVALNQMQPRYLSFLSLMLIPGTTLYREAQKGDFAELASGELLQEARDIIAGLELKKAVFRCNHASNYLPLEGRFPADKERLINELEQAMNGRIDLKPEYLRGL